ncbi:MAG TPA: hypothetical protein VFH63_01710, partial [candidate division Zixibacteria bacterium]|nr:hypothetical protein [candidate division Zixibacteria bacterium]
MASSPISLARARRSPRRAAPWTADVIGDLADADLVTLLLGPGTDGTRLLEEAGGLVGLVRP